MIDFNRKNKTTSKTSVNRTCTNLLIFLIGIVVVMGMGSAYTNDCNGRLDWLKESVDIIASNQKYTDNGTSVIINGTFSWSGGAKSGESLTQWSCDIANDCLNITYNFTSTSFRIVDMPVVANTIINGHDYSGVGFYLKGDGTTNYLGQIKLWSNYSGSTVKFNSLNLPQSARIYLNNTNWQYVYIDFSYILATASGSSPPYLNYTNFSSINGISLVFFNTTAEQYNTVQVADYTLIDLDKGTADYFRWKDKTSSGRNSRYNEGVYTLAWLYLHGGDGYAGNETILNMTLDLMDWFARNQLYDGGWSYDSTSAFGVSQSVPATTGFTGIALASSYKLLMNNSRMNDNLTQYHINNISTNTRSWFINDTLNRMANFTYNNITWNRGFYTEYANQELGTLIAEYLYGNISGDVNYLTDFNNQVKRLNNTRLNSNFGFLKEANTTSNNGFDAGYTIVQDNLLGVAYYLTSNEIILGMISVRDNVYKQLTYSGQDKLNLINSSRGNNLTGNDNDYNNLLYYTANITNNVFMKQFVYNQNLKWNGYGDFTDSTAQNQMRTSFLAVYDYLVCRTKSTENVRFYQNYSFYAYNLFNQTSYTRRNTSISGNIQSRSGFEFPEIFYAYDSSSVGWIKDGRFINEDSVNALQIYTPYLNNSVLSNGTLITGTVLINGNSTLNITKGGYVYVS